MSIFLRSIEFNPFSFIIYDFQKKQVEGIQSDQMFTLVVNQSDTIFKYDFRKTGSFPFSLILLMYISINLRKFDNIEIILNTYFQSGRK